jgi:hypothetical protein
MQICNTDCSNSGRVTEGNSNTFCTEYTVDFFENLCVDEMPGRITIRGLENLFKEKLEENMNRVIIINK